MPCSGSIANCITLVMIVIAPTAISPPYFKSEELKQTEITLSLDCITKAAVPSAIQGRIISFCNLRFSFFMRSVVFFPHRNEIIQMQDTICDIIVASAAPLTPIFKANIKTGSNTILHTAPMTTDIIEIFVNP